MGRPFNPEGIGKGSFDCRMVPISRTSVVVASVPGERAAFLIRKEVMSETAGRSASVCITSGMRNQGAPPILPKDGAAPCREELLEIGLTATLIQAVIGNLNLQPSIIAHIPYPEDRAAP
jgi:hypothetical protein